MPKSLTQNITFKHPKTDKETPAEMFTLVYNDKEQKMRALKTLFKFWLIAALCVLIPIAHFLLVPLFFIMGIMKALKLMHKAEDGLHADGACPACNNNIALNLDGDAELPQWLDCTACHEGLELKK